MSSETVFDKIIAKEILADIVYEDADVLAFRDIDPKAPVHILVVPKKKIASFSDLSQRDDVEVGLFFKAISRVAQDLGLLPNGYRVVLNCGKDGQQSVDYIHAHLLGGRQMTWPPG